MFDALIIAVLYLIIVLGMVVYDYQRKKYHKTRCTLKVGARIVEKKEVVVRTRGFPITMRAFFHPVFCVDIDGAEYFITDNKRSWTEPQIEAYRSLFLWVNPDKPAQFRYDDERLEFHRHVGGDIFACISFMVIVTFAVLAF